jgi:predicted adenylyl cyclase CyaB
MVVRRNTSCPPFCGNFGATKRFFEVKENLRSQIERLVTVSRSVSRHMARNIEIKASLKNRAAALATAARLSDSDSEIILQEDVFFRCKGARLKLRIFAPDRGELIRYERDNVAGARCSHYSIARTADPQVLLDILTQRLGVTGTVKKMRTLYLVGQTRIHIDQVLGLGDFLELEVILGPGQSTAQDEAQGKPFAAELLREFGIGPEELIAEAYVDLLARKTDSAQVQTPEVG